MAMVQCKACGKIYDYEKNGCCPSCGAYNRPPRRERVDADGTVHHLTGQERRSVPRGGKVCFEKKECHEKKVCFEEQARKKPAQQAVQPDVRPAGSAGVYAVRGFGHHRVLCIQRPAPLGRLPGAGHPVLSGP